MKVMPRITDTSRMKRIPRKIFLVVFNTGIKEIIAKTTTPNRAGVIYRSLQLRYCRLA
jgi:hypothetical protein